MTESLPSTTPDRAPPRTLESWLTVLTRMLRLPEADRQSIRSELEEHLRERVRDLMIAGRGEEEAVQAAIAELGEMAELARRFQTANTVQRRRMAMNLSLLGTALGVTVLGVVAFRSPVLSTDHIRTRVFAEPDRQLLDALETRVDLRLEAQPLEESVARLSEVMDRTIFVHWCDLERTGISRTETTITLHASSLPLRRVMDLVLEQVNRQGGPVAWQVSDELIELGAREEFDRRELALVSYDIGEIVNRVEIDSGLDHSEAVEQILQLLWDLVSPTDWHANGGELAQAQVVGRKMFVEAPRRMHERIAWILDELAEPEDPERDG